MVSAAFTTAMRTFLSRSIKQEDERTEEKALGTPELTSASEDWSLTTTFKDLLDLKYLITEENILVDDKFKMVAACAKELDDVIL